MIFNSAKITLSEKHLQTETLVGGLRFKIHNDTFMISLQYHVKNGSINNNYYE